ncbi:uncharacterized protein LOC131680237 [Topomyia yanbarensis]|uniref:uncharacterized protein LOC131680237 n=1 Tax=Topomyia yanbarensis TaxID=2498891 RepID=UPI00273AC5F8|nr:uncharacterized protein LOC131680237 [Topomyia yanbarensis]
MAKNLKRLSKKERYCKDSLNIIERMVANYSDETDRDKLDTWMDRLESIFSQYEEIRLEMDLLDDSEFALKRSDSVNVNDVTIAGDQIQTSREEFDVAYMRLKAFLQSEMRRRSCASNQANVRHAEQAVISQPAQLRVKLPEIRLPLFGGSVKEWPSFRDSFKSLIDSAPQLSSIDKFSYLISALSKEAKRVVEVIDVTSENYYVAWEMLQRRYENKYLIVKSYVDSLFAVEPMKKECHGSLNHLIDEYERNMMMLERVGEETENWSTLLIFMLSS